MEICNKIFPVSDTLPSEMLAGATLRDREYAWSLIAFPFALAIAEQNNLACLGGQIQFHFDDAVYEAYWLNADSSPRTDGEPWNEYVHRSCQEVAQGYADLIVNLNLQEIVQEWPGLRVRLKSRSDSNEALLFAAYFVTQTEYSDLAYP